MTIAIVGDPDDLSAVYVAYKAEERGLPVVRLPESGFGLDWTFSLDDENSGPDTLTLGEESLKLDQVQGAYARFRHDPDAPIMAQLDPDLAEIYLKERRSALHVLLAHLPCPVANKPTAGHSNGSKPYQMALLARAGLATPGWIVSNEVEHIRSFRSGCVHDAIVKSCSGLRSEVQMISEEMISRVAAGSVPVVIQEYIPGHDVRVHTVGEATFATHIRASQGVDYRFSSESGSYSTGEVPSEVGERCRRFAESQELLIAGFDFRVAPDDSWWCLECNPAPTFLPYEMETGQGIADALLDLFASRSGA